MKEKKEGSKEERGKAKIGMKARRKIDRKQGKPRRLRDKARKERRKEGKKG